MNRPGPGVRWMGSPSGALTMFTSCALVVAGAFVGVLPWWAALLAFGFANGTITNVRRMRVYNEWAARWGTMATGSDAAPEAPGKKPRTKRNAVLDVLVGLALLAGLPWLASQAADTAGEKQFLALLWLVDVGYLVFLGVRGFVHRRKARSAAKFTAAELPEKDGPVAWVIESSAESPSRADAMSELPEYASGIISAGEEAQEKA